MSMASGRRDSSTPSMMVMFFFFQKPPVELSMVTKNPFWFSSLTVAS